METSLHWSLLDALAPAITVGRARLPCAVLRVLITRGRPPRCSRALGDRALLLAAIEHALLAAVQTDWPGEILVPTRRQWAASFLGRPALVQGWRFQFAPMPVCPTLRLPRATYAFLSGLDAVLVRRLARWAPPIVSPAAVDDGPVPVLGNVVTAFLARQVDPEGKVWVRVLKQETPAKFSLLDLAAAGIPVLTPIVAQYRDRIVRAAPTAVVAEQVAGLGRAMAFRLRQSKGAACG